MAWDDGYRLLEARVRSLPDALRTGAADTHVPTRAASSDGIVTTGIGSSAAHARFLAQVLSDRLAGRARYVTPSALLEPAPPYAAAQTLVVVSQGLSPNARLLLEGRSVWRHVVLLTAASEDTARRTGDVSKAAFLAALRDTGVEIRRFPMGEDEYTTLVRVVGPMAGYWCALRFADALTGEDPIDVEPVCDALAAAPARLAAALPAFDPAWLEAQLALLVTGTYGELVQNLRHKVLEGMLLPEPPVWDVLQMAHGPFQQAHDRHATFLALTRADAAHEDALLARLEAMLDPARHRLLRLPATLPGPLAVFEHEALLNELLLRYVAARTIDQTRWPGRGRDAPLYALGGSGDPAPDAAMRAPALPRRFDRLTWVELESLLGEAPRTAVVALGSTEQHGPHLPLGTDTLIAEALAERFCARVEDAIQCPVVSLGCAPEHAAFPGTLDLGAGTLRATLLALVRSLRQHGFGHAFVFSAHGGNCATLADALPALREAAAPMRVTAFTDLAALTDALHRTAAAAGVAPEAAGHHAGEIETSIVLALRPGAVRTDALTAGHVDPTADPQSLFYPRVRRTTSSGVIGDPRGAAAARGARYLEAWVDVLLAAYRDEKNRQ
jgi:creatinine amidohydrolase